MKFDRTWQALLNPGAKDEYFFDLNYTLPKKYFQHNNQKYSPINAWWLSEMCRLIYRQEKDEIGCFAGSLTRNDILKNTGFKEHYFLNTGSTQCAVVMPNVQKPEFAIIVFRGTSNFENRCANLNTIPAKWCMGGLVHTGFKNEFNQLWHILKKELVSIKCPVFLTGHSLGAALATLAASKFPPFALYTFGSPRVGDMAFTKLLKNIKIYRIVNNKDIITTMPPLKKPFKYCHVGKLVYLGHKKKHDLSRALDILNIDKMPELIRKYTQKLICPPEYLSDHSPINYTIQLAETIL